MSSRSFAFFVIPLLLAGCRSGVDTSTDPASATVDQPRVSFVAVAPNLELEVLEWSTEGPPLVLLAGATHSAHVYEEFAPHLTDQFWVIGITRRRVGASDVPTGSFGIDDLAQDVIAVLDALSIDDALLMGHSFGGAELSQVVQRWPERVRKAVYLDGAWDFYDMYNADNWFEGWPDVPMGEQDKVSPQAVSAFFARTMGFVLPLGEIRAVHEFDGDGRLVALDPNVGTMFRDMIRPTLTPLDYSRFAMPVLVIRAIPKRVEDFFRGYAFYDSRNQQLARDAFEKWVRVVVSSADRFVKGIPSVRVLRIENGSHEVIQVHAGQILARVREFLLE